MPLDAVSKLAITIETRYGEQAARGLTLHLRSSPDGQVWDTTDLRTLEVDLDAGGSVVQTFDLETGVRFLRILAENRDRQSAATEIAITVTLSG